MYLEERLTLLEFEVKKAELLSFHFLLAAKAPFRLSLFFQQIQWWHIWRAAVLCFLLDILFAGVCAPTPVWRSWRACRDNLCYSTGMVSDSNFLVALLLLPATQNAKDLCNIFSVSFLNSPNLLSTPPMEAIPSLQLFLFCFFESLLILAPFWSSGTTELYTVIKVWHTLRFITWYSCVFSFCSLFLSSYVLIFKLRFGY